MGLIKKINNFFRRSNVSTVTDETFDKRRIYVDPLISNNRKFFTDIRARHFVAKQDPIGSTLCIHLSERLTMKPILIYDEHYGKRILPEISTEFEDLGGMEMLREIIEHLIKDGYNLWDPYLLNGKFSWFNYGSFESRPAYWQRAGEARNPIDPNQIMFYRVYYIPQYEDTRWGGASNMQSVRKFYRPDEIFHMTRGRWNDGYGESILKKSWDSITKLRIASNSDMFKRDIRGVINIAKTASPAEQKQLVDAANKWTSHRWLVNRVDIDNQRKPTGLPEVRMTSLSEGSNPTNTYNKSTTGKTLEDPEWGRMFASSRLSKMWWIGAEAGTLAGGDVTFTQDIIEEMHHFYIVLPEIKKVLRFMSDNGLISPLPEKFTVKYWREHEILISIAAKKELGEVQEQKDEITQTEETIPETENEEVIIKIVENTQEPTLSIIPREVSRMLSKIPENTSLFENDDLSLENLYRKKFNKFAKQAINHSFGDHTIDLIKTLIKAEKNAGKTVFRFNSTFIGTPMDFDIALYYPAIGGGVNKEYACKRDWKKFTNGKRVKIQLFHNNEQHVVGDGLYSWDDATDKPVITTDLDRADLLVRLEQIGAKDTRLYNRIAAGEPIPISTEYNATIIIHNGKKFQMEFRDLGLALVNQGNCPDNLCALVEKQEVTA